MGNGDRQKDVTKIYEANRRTADQLLDYLLTSHGFTGYFSGRCVDGRIVLMKFEHTHPVDAHGDMKEAVRHDPEKL